ncbi:MAG: phosphonoacetaldehyde hydrolase [Clostridia bacterium]
MQTILSPIQKVNAVIFDWAGTTIDYGCFAPLDVFIKVFGEKQIRITAEEARKPMGLMKKDHIAELFRMEGVRAQWSSIYGKEPGEKEVESIYSCFEPKLMEILPKYCMPIKGVPALMESLRAKGLKIGSTTGYTSKMMETVTREAKKNGYAPDVVVTPDEVPAGRPFPFMCYLNAVRLGVFPLETMVKVGDTVSDIKEGVHAGLWSVGVLEGGSELGLSEKEVEAMDPLELDSRKREAAARFHAAGAHFIADSIQETEIILEEINRLLGQGIHPHGKRGKANGKLL